MYSESKSGADTYAGHYYSAAPESVINRTYERSDRSHTKNSMASRAYGMEHGNWLHMDASIQDKTLLDTTTNVV